MDEIKVEAPDFQRAAKAMKGADKAIQKEVTAAFRRVAKPFGRDVLVTGASRLPKQGGLAYKVAGMRVNANVSSMRATVSLGRNLKAIDEGNVRHPVFARQSKPRTWVRQQVQVGVFKRPFDAGADRVAREGLDAMQTVLSQIKADAS